MNKFEQNFNADKRREKAENENRLSLSHWRGELHSHTKTDISKPELPEDIIENRKGSNCGTIPLEVLTRYHAEQMLNDYIAITEHSRDGSPDKAISGMTSWFESMYLNNADWLKKNYKKTKTELTTEELEEIKSQSVENAKEVALYGDERLEAILNDIDKLEIDNKSFKVLKGVEASILPDGSLDTPLIDKGNFDIVNVSIHPNINPELFKSIISDPDKYSQLMIKGINNPKTNIASHIGEGIDPTIFNQLDWDAIAKSARENNVAIEINLKKIMDYIQGELYDFNKYPTSDNSYLSALENKLDELVPILSSRQIRNTLKKQIELGLKLAINTDEHKNRFIKTKIDKDNIESNFNERGIRFWRCMKVLENYFNGVFSEMGVEKDDIINTFKQNKLENFLKKNN